MKAAARTAAVAVVESEEPATTAIPSKPVANKNVPSEPDGKGKMVGEPTESKLVTSTNIPLIMLE